MHQLNSAFVLGFHGCDKSIGAALLDSEPFKQSENSYDWLGPGAYFWESNPKRGLDFVTEMSKLPRFKTRFREPFVVGAVIDLGNCLDLTTQIGIQKVKAAYESLKTVTEKAGLPLPSNKHQNLLRHLDCAVINQLHLINKAAGLPAIDTVKGIFVEGDPIYPDAGFREKTHTQICVCNPNSIKGVFKVADRFIT